MGMLAERTREEKSADVPRSMGPLAEAKALGLQRMQLAASMLTYARCPIRRVLDLGCGLGDFAAFLPEDVVYTGIDDTLWARQLAQQSTLQRRFIYADPRTYLAAMGESYDLIVGLGLLATVPPRRIPWLLSLMRRTGRHFLLSAQDPNAYAGVEYSYDLEHFKRLLGRLLISRAVRDDTEVTALFCGL